MNFSKNELTKLLETYDYLSNEEKLKLLKHFIDKDTNLSVLFEICDQLNNEEKGKLFKYLIGKDTNLSVLFEICVYKTY